MTARIIAMALALALACPGLLQQAWAADADVVLKRHAASAGELQPASTYEPSVADLSAAGLLATARDALLRLDEVAPLPGAETAASASAGAAEDPKASINDVDRDALFGTAIAALTALYQLHGCRWALAPLRELYQRPGCPPMHLGYSADGRVLLRVEPLQLRKPVFADYTVLLCTLESNTALHLQQNSAALLRVMLLDGSVIEAQALTTSHPLYGDLSRLADTFAPPPELPSGAQIAFKQLFDTPGVTNLPISAVLLSWGGCEINVTFYENEVGIER
jgi:hypothetical protein